jgi:hypothetical protein
MVGTDPVNPCAMDADKAKNGRDGTAKENDLHRRNVSDLFNQNICQRKSERR